MAEKQRGGWFDLKRSFTKEQEKWIDIFVEKLPDTNSICIVTYSGGHGAFKQISFAADIELIAPNNSQGFVIIRDEDIHTIEDDNIHPRDMAWFSNNCRKIKDAYIQHLKEYPFEEVFRQKTKD